MHDGSVMHVDSYQDFVIGDRMGPKSLAIKRDAIRAVRRINGINLAHKQSVLRVNPRILSLAVQE